MSYYRNRRPDNGNELFSWILILILLVTLWPVGIILLVRKLVGMGRRPQFPYLGPSPGTQGVRTPPPNAAGKRPSLGKGKAMTIIGAIMAVIFGIATVSGLPVVSSIWGFPMSLAAMSPVIGLFAGGLALMAAGSISTRKAKRFRKYLALIGRRESVSVVQLAHAMPVSVRKACSDLQEMLDEGILPAGYLDMSSHELILSDEGLKDEPEPEKTEEALENDVIATLASELILLATEHPATNTEPCVLYSVCSIRWPNEYRALLSPNGRPTCRISRNVARS